MTKTKASKKPRWNTSPVGWYVGSYVLRFIELAEQGNFDPERRFLTWENTVLVQASDLDDAYDKIAEIAQRSTEPYKGGAEGVDVQWIFEGITEILPIFDEIESGAEIMWAEYTKKLKTIQRRVRQKGEFEQYRNE